MVQTKSGRKRKSGEKKTVTRVPFYPNQMPDHENEMAALMKSFQVRALLIKNKTRGKVGELMAITMIDREKRDGVIMDKKCFKTPDGVRRVDAFYEQDLIAIESKNTYVCASKFIKRQIEKDAYLLEHGICREIIWAISRGASENARDLLDKSKISVRVGLDQIAAKK